MKPYNLIGKILIITACSTMGFGLMVSDVLAFPDWIGVYGSYLRHDGANPGVFTILMNQDYWGLHAGVGIRVDAGDWTEFEMTYIGNVDGNSLWQYSPPQAFGPCATVRYYFHGWDDWGGGIWDNNGGSDYWVIFPDPATVFDDGVGIPSIKDLEIFRNVAYIVAGGEDGLKFASRELTEANWSDWVYVHHNAHYQNACLAVNDTAIVVAFMDTASAVSYRSLDGGLTFSGPTPIQIIASTMDLTARGVDEFHLVGGNEDVGYVVACSSSLDNGATWNTPVQVYQFPQSGLYDGLEVHIDANEQNVFVMFLYTAVDGQQFGTSTLHTSVSSTGILWTHTQPATFEIVRGNYAYVDLLATPETAYIASSFTGSPFAGQRSAPTVWRYQAGDWLPGAIPDVGGSDQIALAIGPSQEVIFIQAGIWTVEPGYYISCDNGEHFDEKVVLPVPSVFEYSDRILDVITARGAMYLSWLGFTSRAELYILQKGMCEYGMLGDPTDDGLYTAGDAQLAFLISLGSYTPNEGESWRADANSDRQHSAGDAQCIFYAALGYPNCMD